MKPRISLLIVMLVMVLIPGTLLAQPGEKELKKYQEWVGGKQGDSNSQSYIKDRKQYYDEMKSQVENAVGNGQPSGFSPFLRGAPTGVTNTIATIDEFLIKPIYFPACNDFRIWSWKKFFDKPDPIPFSCFFGVTGNDGDTGGELKDLLCEIDRGACGVHMDNRHNGVGGGVGIGIIAVVPTGLPICERIYVTGTYVEYFFPWFLLNSSRQMYQSGYLDMLYVALAQRFNKAAININAVFDVAQDLMTVHEVNAKEMMDYGYPGMASYNASLGALAATQQVVTSANNVLQFGMNNPQLTDLSPHSSVGYARNLSTSLDIEFMKGDYWYVPHWGKDTHRFGTDLPAPIFDSDGNNTTQDLPAVPLPRAQDNGPEKANKGGIVQSRFLTKSGDKDEVGTIMEKKFKLFTAQESAGGNQRTGPRICMANNKEQVSKTPEDLDRNVEKQKDTNDMCIDKVGNKFPLLSSSYSLHDTDAFWRSIWTGGLDTFYALNWLQFFEAPFWGKYIIAGFPFIPTKFHTYFLNVDRLAILPNPLVTNLEMVTETQPCQTLDKLPNFNVNYMRSNLHDLGWGAQNTAHVFAYAKGVWGFKAWPPLFIIPHINPMGWSRHPEIYVRFN